jgi:hypothetical protein
MEKPYGLFLLKFYLNWILPDLKAYRDSLGGRGQSKGREVKLKWDPKKSGTFSHAGIARG